MKKILMTLTLALGAAIAIPTVANAQSTTSTEQTKECCKEKKECSKEKKECVKEGQTCPNADGKACCKEGKRKMKDGKFAKGDRKMKAPKDARMGNGDSRENPMLKGITLSDEQKAQMQALKEKNMTAEKKTKADMKAKSKDEIQKLRSEFDKEIEKILDKDQLKQYQANKAEMQARRKAKKKS